MWWDGQRDKNLVFEFGIKKKEQQIMSNHKSSRKKNRIDETNSMCELQGKQFALHFNELCI